jgi:hypothetical protein
MAAVSVPIGKILHNREMSQDTNQICIKFVFSTYSSTQTTSEWHLYITSLVWPEETTTERNGIKYKYMAFYHPMYARR